MIEPAELIELENIHFELKNTEILKNISCVKGKHSYYHYCCDNYNDNGFGCGYRTTQTICSWLKQQIDERNRIFNQNDKVSNVPSVLEIQKILVDCGDKPSKFIGSRDWIGCFESSIIIDYLYDVPCKIKYCPAGSLEKNLTDIQDHFQKFSSPIMMGGDFDNASKGILGIGNDKINENFYILVADPHLKQNKIDKTVLINEKWISWTRLDEFNIESFYNFCLPQRKAN